MKTLFIRIVTFYREGVGVYKRLGCSQSIFEKPKHSVCFITSCSTMFSYCMNFCSWLRTVNSICSYLFWLMKIKTSMFFWSLNNEFANTLQNPIFSNGRVLEAGIFLRYMYVT